MVCAFVFYFMFFFLCRSVRSGRQLVRNNFFLFWSLVCRFYFYAAVSRVFYDRRLNGMLNAPYPIGIGSGGEHDGESRASRAPCPTDAVHVVIDVARYVVIEYMRYAFNVDTSGYDVRSDEDLRLGLGKVAYDLRASPLRHITVQLGRVKILGNEFACKLRSAFFCITEDDCQIRVPFLQHFTEKRKFIIFFYYINTLFNIFERDRFTFADGQAERLAHVFFCQAADLGRKGGGEEEELPLFRRHTDELVHFFEKSRLQHLVGFVNDDMAHAAQIKGIAAAMVEKTAGRADNDLRMAVQLLQLIFNRLAADKA